MTLARGEKVFGGNIYPKRRLVWNLKGNWWQYLPLSSRLFPFDILIANLCKSLSGLLGINHYNKYMKKFLITFLLLTLSLPVSSQILTGGVEVSVQDARESLQCEPSSFDYGLVKRHSIDAYRNENLGNLLKGYTELKDRTLAYFSDGSYAVNYKDDVLHVFYYSPKGTLTHLENRSSVNYPYKSYKYNTSGELVNKSLRVSKNETFIFDKNDKLLAHWVGENCYDEDGNIIMKRKFVS